MVTLQNVDSKHDLLREFFIWLFEDKYIQSQEVVLTKDIDYTMCSTYNDPYIYYPEQIKNFFETKAMKRLSRISQLDFIINNFPNAYHSRLEHSKGVYNKKVEELFYNYQNPEWKKNIENNNLKLYLIASLIKSAGHDIGHLPFSHGLEIQLFGKKGAHEIIGKRIMLENAEIQESLNAITPKLNLVLKELYEKDVLNFKTHDESNYDNDRLDYLNRDNLYLGCFEPLPIQQYTSVTIQTDENGLPLQNSDGSIEENESGNKKIDVYEYCSLQEIEKLLELRKKGYTSIYMSPHTIISEGNLKSFLETFQPKHSKLNLSFRNYLQYLHTSEPENIDLDIFINWDEVKVYSELIDIAQNNANEDICAIATMLIPVLQSFLNIMYSYLDVKNKGGNYSAEDKKILKQIKQLITGDNQLFTRLKNNNFVSANTLYFLKKPFTQENKAIDYIQHFSSVFCTYKKDEPIYIKDKNGKIFELSQHPNRKKDWDKDVTKIDFFYSNVPYLRVNNISENEINTLREQSEPFNNLLQSQNIKTNMQPLQVGHNIENSFLEL